MEGSMTDRRKERDRERRKRRKAREAAERRRAKRNRRFDELVEAWRRNHPGEHEEDRKGRPRREDALLSTTSPDKDKPQRAAPAWVVRDDWAQLSGRPAAP
jgi:hypothetical protein